MPSDASGTTGSTREAVATDWAGDTGSAPIHGRSREGRPLLLPGPFLFSTCSGVGLDALFRPTAIGVILLMVPVRACLLPRVAQFELLVASLSHLASRVFMAWQ